MEKEQSLCKEKTHVELSEPKHYKVVFHNDDFTTMGFVVKVLQLVFFKSQQQAEELAMQIHIEGLGTAGIYSYDIAQSKAQKTTQMAREEGYPLRLTVEPEDK